jgi:trimeric autotransporter adhesin
MRTLLKTAALSAAMLVVAPTSFAGEVTGLTSFIAGTPARASDVNGNFAATKTAVDDNHRRVAALETAIVTLQSTVTSQAATIAALEAKLANISVTTVNGQPTVRFSGVNVQIVNGENSTAVANGRGNLIVGYDEADTSGNYRCSLGTNPATNAAVLNQAACATAGGTWSNQGFKTGSHYIIAGSQNNYSRWGGVVSGFRNTSNYDYANVTGGDENSASGLYASVSGGWRNYASGGYASISGGGNNRASGQYSSVSGGGANIASGEQSSVNGGASNSASGAASSVNGGASSYASGQFSSANGGSDNRALHTYSSILGGVGQTTASDSQTIPALP